MSTYEPSRERGVDVALYLVRQLEVGGSIGCTPDELLDLAYAVLDEYGESKRFHDALEARKPKPKVENHDS